ncbi:MAG: hotdog domain-containing protein [Oscillospiraceae bacterium]
MKEWILGTTYECTAAVTADQLASSVKSGTADVFATPALAALLEQAAMLCMAQFLEGDETSVGTALSITHDAATPLGMLVTARAELVAAEGRRAEFKLEAHDECERISAGTHTRFVVFQTRFQQKCDAKKQG